jgi:hypothetical protein
MAHLPKPHLPAACAATLVCSTLVLALVSPALVSLGSAPPTGRLRALSITTLGPFVARIASARRIGAQAEPQDQPTSAEPEKKISRQEAARLFEAVAEILKFASQDTGLPIKHAVKAKLKSREDVVSYLAKSMREDKGAQRVYRSELVLKKFGLLPRDYHLETSVVGMLREQIAGFYDPKKKTMNLLDWVPAEQQRAVLAHELTHALQDQSIGLEKWMGKGDIDLDKKKELTFTDIENDEQDDSREAVVEGQAETVMMDYMLSSTGRTVLNSPDAIAALDADMLNGGADSAEYKNAPIFLKESLTFPYRYGLKFVVALLQHGGKPEAFSGPFRKVPRVTREIMEPATYLSGERLDPMPLPDFKSVFKDYDRFDVGSIGEFDVSVLIEQYAGLEASRRLFPAWRGGYYYAVQPKRKASNGLGLLYVSRWADAKGAAEFADIYAHSLEKRYQKVEELAREPRSEGSPAARSVDARRWQTEQGAVVLATSENTVLVSESLDEAATAELERQILVPSSHPASAKLRSFSNLCIITRSGIAEGSR